MDPLVTLIGGGGFLGRYAARELMHCGARVRLVSRYPKQSWFLRTQGALGQMHYAAADLARPDTIRAAVKGSDAVVNLVGILKGDFHAVHVEGARTAALAADQAGAKAFVQLSAIGADPESPSAYGRSKAEGEAAVRDVFPTATVLRPAVVFGPEDDFLNKFARMSRLPVVPVLRPGVRFQPVFAADVGRAIARAALDPTRFGGQTFELGGPQVMTMREVNAYAAHETAHRPTVIELPDAAGELMAKFGFLPGAPITRDQWAMLGRDTVVSEGAEGLKAFGIAPTPLEAVAPSWLVRYRRHGRFTKPTLA